ncbi:MAG: AAA family ATPase [bacterium]
MKLISLKLENFRQHKNTSINFTNGITVITGMNGSGKSTVLEAISWAIYGTEAARGNKDSIKFNKAEPRSKVVIELVFALDSETYKVKREFSKAEVYLNDNPAPIAITQDEVSKYLREKLGMDRTEFFNTYFTGQKELDFLSNKGPTDRRKFISKVLNYEKVKIAQDKVRIDKNNTDREIAGIKQGLEDFEKIELEKKQTQEELATVSKNLKEKQSELEKYTLELGKLHPVWSKIQAAGKDFNKYNTELNFIVDKINEFEKNIKDFNNQNAELEIKTKRLEELEKYLDEYKKTEAEIIQQEELQKYEFKKQKSLTNLENIEQEINKYEKKITEIFSSAESKKDIPAKIQILKQEINKLKELIQQERTDWTSKKQEILTLKKQKQIEIEKVRKQCLIIGQKGENGVCPTCERPLKGEFDKVINNFNENINNLNQEILNLANQETELSKEPEILKEKFTALQEKEKEFEKLNKEQGKLEEEIKIYENLKTDIAKKKELKSKINEELEKIPQGFNSKRLEKLKEDFPALKKFYEEALGLKVQILNKKNIEKSLEEALYKKQEAQNRKIELESILKQLNYSEDEYKKVQEQVLSVEKSCNESKLEVAKTQGKLNQVNAVLNKILEAEKNYLNKLELIKTKQAELNHLAELDRFYGYFLEKLNNQARPELSEIASEFLSELTDGRYSVLELNEKYEICLREDHQSEIKSVISGGEEDIANLCVRLAISKMIAQRSGRTLSLLILDEVFGSLDETRRTNVVELLNNLMNDFEQIILITHIDDIKENIDNIIKVEFDETQGCSIVKTVIGEFNVNSDVIARSEME